MTLPIPEPGRRAAQDFVVTHFDRLYAESDGVDDSISLASSAFRGGQSEADRRLANIDLNGFIKNRSNAYPAKLRAATELSPYIRYGLLDLPTVWNGLESKGSPAEVARARLELLWQEYARHRYARLGQQTKRQPTPDHSDSTPKSDWDRTMGCVEITTGELEDDGWLVNQSRLWLASQWTVRMGNDWASGEDYFFRHLLDGSRAANRLGWTTAAGVESARPYVFARSQVEHRAPGLCSTCDYVSDCPIDDLGQSVVHLKPENAISASLVDSDPDLAVTIGPTSTQQLNTQQSSAQDPEAVWLTAESLGDADPALAAHPDLPAVFVFDRPLLAKLQLSSKRLVFIVETLAELALRRPLELHLGTPVGVLGKRPVAATYAPVPGWKRHSANLNVVTVHPWRWLHAPVAGNLGSFNVWFEQISGHRLDQRPLPELMATVPKSPLFESDKVS